MEHKLKLYELAGALFVIITGTLLHFVYGWTGNNSLVGLIAPVSESTWEHLKLLFTPMLVFTIFEYFMVGRAFPGYWPAKAAGLLAGMFTIVALFYTYSGILGFNTLWIDILTFLLGVICAYAVSYRLLISDANLPRPVDGIAVFIILLVLFAYYTSAPPSIGLFADPMAR